MLQAREKGVGEDLVHHTPWPRRLAIIFLSGLLLTPLFFAATWVYATGQLTLAKNRGIDATAEEGMRSKLLGQYEGSETEPRVTIVGAGPNRHDGKQPHVWFVGAKVWVEQRPDGKSTAPRGYYSGGSYFLRVQEGWVHVPEGAFPILSAGRWRFMDWRELVGNRDAIMVFLTSRLHKRSANDYTRILDFTVST